VGYLRVVEIALLHSLRWANTLVLTAAAALIAGSVSPALAQAGDAESASIPTVQAKPGALAGWRLQPIRRPYAARSSQLTTAQPPDGAAMRLRAGYGRTDGSAAVRRLQRILLGLGYESGRAEGWFGPRNEASAQWFQTKHGLFATGVADAKTLLILRFRDGLAAGADRRAAARSSVIASPPAWPRADASPTQYEERHNGPSVVRSVLLALVLPLALVGLALLARAAPRRRVARGPRAAPVAAGRRLAASSRGLTAIGCARGRDAVEFKRQKAVIERGCSQRGLGALLEWCAGHRVDPVAAAVARDTSMHDGRPVADRLVVAAAWNAGAHDARRTAPRRPTSRHSQRIPRQTGRNNRGPMAPQAPAALIGWTR
jgi:hypothetical protein